MIDPEGPQVFDGALLAEYQTGPAPAVTGREWCVADHVGSQGMKLDATGTVTAYLDYEPYGLRIARSGESYGATDMAAERFTGKERDADTGLDYFGAGYYSGAPRTIHLTGQAVQRSER